MIGLGGVCVFSEKNPSFNREVYAGTEGKKWITKKKSSTLPLCAC